MNDYQRISDAIDLICRDFHSQPTLTDLARAVNLGPSRFQRLFLDFAGVSPKKFVQFLTAETARKHLKNGASVLHASLQSGLSGPGRLHDLTVRIDAASPGEIKSGGRNLPMTVGFAESPFGRCLIAESPRGMTALRFVDESNEVESMTALQAEWPQAEMERDDIRSARTAASIFRSRPHDPESTSSPLHCFLHGTRFQIQVWRALLQIPPGRLAGYRDIARAIGSPGAARAVGSAIARNPIGYLIPCHRVIRSNGVIGEYRWGTTRKRILIATELASRNSENAERTSQHQFVTRNS